MYDWQKSERRVTLIAWIMLTLGIALLIVASFAVPVRATGFDPFKWMEERQPTPAVIPVQQGSSIPEMNSKQQICAVLHFGIGLPITYSPQLLAEMRTKLGDAATRQFLVKTIQANRAYRCMCLSQAELTKRGIRCGG